MDNNQSNFNGFYQNSMPNVPAKKKKVKWWIPILFFVGGFVMLIGNFVAEEIIRSRSTGLLEFQMEHEFVKSPVVRFFRTAALLSWLLVIPSIIVIVVIYIKRRKKSE